MSIKRNIKSLLVGRGPWTIVCFVICLGIIYDCITNFEELTTKEWIKSILFFCLFFWAICNHFKNDDGESNPKNDSET
jgi:hypothetical protein